MQEVQQMLRLWEQGDPETVALWRKLNNWVYAGFDATYKSIGVSFDKTYYESNTYLLGKEIVEEGLQKGVFYRKDDGSVWIDLTEEGLDQKLVLRSDGTSVYMTQDLGTTDLKVSGFPQRPPDLGCRQRAGLPFQRAVCHSAPVGSGIRQRIVSPLVRHGRPANG